MDDHPEKSGTHVEVPGLADFTQIGRGASSTVYRAHDRELNRWVAVKVLLVDDIADPAGKRFQREREITANLGKHPHIVQVLTTGFTPTGLPYVVMELYEQGSIADHLRTNGAFTVPEVIDIGTKIADAMVAAHRADVLHRDIKPANVLISEYGPALADFGIARTSTNLEWSQSLDQLTPMHAAPEILLGEQPTVQADVYSLGSTLYTMLAGRPPFAGPANESPLKYQVRVSQDPVPPFARSDVPDELTGIIHRALAKSAVDRYATAAELRDALQELRPRTHVAVRPPTPVVQAPAFDEEDDGTIARELPVGDRAGEEAPARWSLHDEPPSPKVTATTESAFGPLVAVPHAGDETPTTFRKSTKPVETVEPAESRNRGRILVGIVGAVAAAIVVVVAVAVVGGNSNKGNRGSHATVTLPVGKRHTSPAADFTLTDAPTHLGVSLNKSGTSVTLTWKDQTGGAGKYLVWEVPSNGAVEVHQVPGVGATGAVVNALTADGAYCFVINAIGAVTNYRLAPSCICIRGGRLAGVPSGFPQISCATA